MKLLFTGYCGRSHAIIAKIAADPRVEKVFWAPGNAGNVPAKVENIPIAADDGGALVTFAEEEEIDLTIVSQNFAIFKGVVDRFKHAGLQVYGPTSEMAALEWNKIWAKQFFAENDIPSPGYRLVNGKEEIIQTAKSVPLPAVVKYGGLAYGGGVFVCHSRRDALAAAQSITASRINTVTGREDAVIFEEFVTGKEVSMHFMIAGDTSVFIGAARDYKRALDGDQGPNTAGMGSYSSSDHADSQMIRQVQERIIQPTVQGMRNAGMPYHGVLYAGIMLTDNGPVLLEFNCRFGDSECQAILGRLETSLLDLFLATDLGGAEILFNDKACITVCMCTRDYPLPTEKQEHIISGLDRVDEDVRVYHYGTKRRGGHVLTPTGRVLSVTADGSTRQEVHRRIYSNVSRISWPGVRFRSDIGLLP